FAILFRRPCARDREASGYPRSAAPSDNLRASEAPAPVKHPRERDAASGHGQLDAVEGSRGPEDGQENEGPDRRECHDEHLDGPQGARETPRATCHRTSRTLPGVWSSSEMRLEAVEAWRCGAAGGPWRRWTASGDARHAGRWREA